MKLTLPWERRAAAVGAAVLFVGLSVSAYLAIIGFTIWESGRYGRANVALYALDGALTYPAHLAAGLRGGGSGGGADGILVRVLSVLGAALFWGACAGLTSYLKPRNKIAHRAAAAFIFLIAALSAASGYLSIVIPR